MSSTNGYADVEVKPELESDRLHAFSNQHPEDITGTTFTVILPQLNPND